MGLDITAYSNLKHIGKHEKDPELNEGEPGGPDDYCYYEHHVDAYAYDSFPDSFRGIPVLGTKGHGNNAFIVAGCFEITPQTETHGFRAGSYSGYGQWRQNLASQFNPAALYLDRKGPGMAKPGPDLPFYELIWFADNEGCIGPEAAADLLADFREHADKYVDPYDGYGRQKYDDWTRAFELAERISLHKLHLISECQCVLGQLFGNFYAAPLGVHDGLARDDRAAALGFLSTKGDTDAAPRTAAFNDAVDAETADYAALDAEWRRLILARREAGRG